MAFPLDEGGNPSPRPDSSAQASSSFLDAIAQVFERDAACRGGILKRLETPLVPQCWRMPSDRSEIRLGPFPVLF